MNPYLVLKDYLSEKKSGDDGTVDTPVPIPNTEVKHLSGDNSMACSCEDSTLPGYLGTHLSSFFLFSML